MAFDKREAILERLLAILQGVAGALADPPFVFRNRGEVPTEKLPAFILFDGRESIAISAHTRGGIKTPTVFSLQPQVFVILRQTENISIEGSGEALSAYRMALLKGFETDDDLFALLGSNGEFQYLGHETDYQNGAPMLGQMLLLFNLTYVLSSRDF